MKIVLELMWIGNKINWEIIFRILENIGRDQWKC